MLTMQQEGGLKAQGQPDVCIQWNSFSKSKNRHKHTYYSKSYVEKVFSQNTLFCCPFPFSRGAMKYSSVSVRS